MFIHPEINPVAFQVGPVSIYWYGLTYLVGFLAAWWLGNYRARLSQSAWNGDQVSDVIFYGALGVVIGGRVGYMLFYDFAGLIADPLSLGRTWQGGMSFHGGLLGVLIALWFLSRKFKKPFFAVTDFVVPLVPIGLGAGRIGNFINGELWGRVTDAPWAMIFARVDALARHPSQLYEFFLEGVLMFIILWWYSASKRLPMRVSALFLMLYGAFRFLVEFFREPDAALGFVALNWMSMGQLLSLPLLLLGMLLWYRSGKQVL